LQFATRYRSSHIDLRLKHDLAALIARDAQLAAELDSWATSHAGEVFVLSGTGSGGLLFRSLGPREEACREPFQIASHLPDPSAKQISNFARAPFTLDSRSYENVEAFWQGLKFPRDSDRRRLAKLSGQQARKAGDAQGYPQHIEYEGTKFTPGTADHWDLMEQACTAKFTQHIPSAEALLSTGTRPLAHPARRDSRTIPGVIMSSIWMRIRSHLADGSLPIIGASS
jgi:predicted NAD-dependent protein-ADP-ribosyltransferase YbiA (DUF1768 family)